MDSERWQRLRQLFDAATDLEASKRPAFIERSCEGDPELQRSLESLLAHSVETGSSFEQAFNEAVDLEGSFPTNLDLLGRTLGHYRIIEKIGEGGMGEVYRATDTRLGRDVAIKILPEDFTRDPERLARFDREAQVLASLNHPNIATIYGIDEVEGTRFLVLELLKGATLRSSMENGPLPLNTVIRLAAQIGAGLAKAHEAGIVHRDLKPDNLMLTDDGFIKILDFGLAKAVEKNDGGDSAMPTAPDLDTRPGRIMGTVNYMSPEQARGAEVDFRSDQFSFGSVLSEMATGTRAFGGETDADTLVAIMRQDPARPEDFEARVPAPLRSVIERCLAKDPEDRYESTRELARALRHLKALFWEIIESEITDKMRVQTTSKRVPAVVAISVILVLIVVAVLWWQSRGEAGKEIASPAEVTASIAVLPLENLGPDGQEYFADGMTDALITHLSKIEALKVISRTSVMQYKGVQKPLPEIARELGAETVLTGSVLHAGDRVRISTQLVEADTDRNLWAESYEQDLRDILALQSEVARAIARAVDVEVGPDEAVRMAVSRAIDPVAHDAFVRGLAYLDAADLEKLGRRDSIRSSFAHFQRAIEFEPEWAKPHARLAGAYFWLASLGGPDVQWEFYPKAKTAALRALELDDTVAEAHLTLGRVLLNHEWKWQEAERSFRRAVELDPNANNWGLARYLMKAGRFDEAIEQYKKARERDPMSSRLLRQLGIAYLVTGRPDVAEDLARRLIEEYPDSHQGYRLLFRVFMRSERYEEAVTVLEKHQDEMVAVAPWTAGAFPVALAKAGRVEEAREIVRELEASGAHWFPELYWVLGEEDKAMAQIEAAFAVRRDVLLNIRGSESCMEHPRCREIMEAIGFPNLTYPTSTPPAPA
jgi:TolB-like protein